jgi:hypothetical protein
MATQSTPGLAFVTEQKKFVRFVTSDGSHYGWHGMCALMRRVLDWKGLDDLRFVRIGSQALFNRLPSKESVATCHPGWRRFVRRLDRHSVSPLRHTTDPGHISSEHRSGWPPALAHTHAGSPWVAASPKLANAAQRR